MVSEHISVSLCPLDSLNDARGLLQSAFWGCFKSDSGWKPRGFRWSLEQWTGHVLVLECRLPGRMSYAYVPYGPEVPAEWGPDELAVFLSALGKGMKQQISSSCIFVRFDLAAGTRAKLGSPEADLWPPPLPLPLKASPVRVQPQHSLIISLEPDEEEILSSMSRKTRYNIRLAGRKGLSIHSFDAKEAMEHLAPWYAIYCETAVRDGISIYPLSYYRRLFSLSLEREIPCRDVRVQNGFSCSRDQSLSRGQELSRELKVPKLCLYMASYDGTLLAGIIVAIWGKRATYLYGASSARHRELMPNHLLQWIAICDSRKAGAVEYDLFGLPGGADPGDSMHGLWRFKTGFGGILVHYFGAWDLPLRPVVYRFVRILEKGRRLIRKIF